MSLRHHHPDLELPSVQFTGQDVAMEASISWPASENLRPGDPVDQPGWHHGFRHPTEDELYAGNEQGESPRKGMGSSGPKYNCEMCSKGHHPAFHVPEEGDLNPGEQFPSGMD